MFDPRPRAAESTAHSRQAPRQGAPMLPTFPSNIFGILTSRWRLSCRYGPIAGKGVLLNEPPFVAILVSCTLLVVPPDA